MPNQPRTTPARRATQDEIDRDPAVRMLKHAALDLDSTGQAEIAFDSGTGARLLLTVVGDPGEGGNKSLGAKVVVGQHPTITVEMDSRIVLAPGQRYEPAIHTVIRALAGLMPEAADTLDTLARAVSAWAA